MKITNEQEYNQALSELSDIFDSKPDDPNWARMLTLASAIESYEAIHYPLMSETSKGLRALNWCAEKYNLPD